jgi:hypothetical protein
MKTGTHHRKEAINKRRGINILELLLALSILSVSMYPIVHIFRIAHPPRQKTHSEYLATLLAHHVMETIIARKAKDPSYLPDMSNPEPIVQTSDAVAHVSEFFREIGETGESISEQDNQQLFWSLKEFSCNIDTYYLEGALFKPIVYISYVKDGRNMRVFLERLLSQTDSESDEETR